MFKKQYGKTLDAYRNKPSGGYLTTRPRRDVNLVRPDAPELCSFGELGYQRFQVGNRGYVVSYEIKLDVLRVHQPVLVVQYPQNHGGLWGATIVNLVFDALKTLLLNLIRGQLDNLLLFRAVPLKDLVACADLTPGAATVHNVGDR